MLYIYAIICTFFFNITTCGSVKRGMHVTPTSIQIPLTVINPCRAQQQPQKQRQKDMNKK